MKACIRAALLCALAAGCVAAPPAMPRTATQPASALPSWHYQPLSWSKLEALETWLASSAGAPARVRAQARLELAEGRLTFARREEALLPPQTLAQRLEACARDFRAVSDDLGATPDQRARAERGLRSLETRPPVAAPFAPAAPLVSRAQWSARPPIFSRLTRQSGRYSRATVHHTALPNSELGSALADSASHVRGIQRAHVEDERWGDVGYHFLIDPAGRVFEGRSLAWQGAHAGGSNNVDNIGVCLLGHFDRERPSEAALRSLGALLEQLRQRYAFARERVYAHGELKTTECPGQHLRSWLGAYRGGRSPLARPAPSPAPRAAAWTPPRARSSAKVR